MSNWLKKILRVPRFLVIRKQMTFFYRKCLQIRDESIPKVPLQKKHIQNCRLILNRDALLEEMKNGAIVAEIGVDEGEFSEKILNKTKPAVLHLVDIWGSKRYNDEKYLRVIDKFTELINVGKIRIHRNLSIDAVVDFPESYFDWIYIDTDHSFKTTQQELIMYASKLKPSGIIAGHDYSMGNWVKSYRYGVIEAVHKFCVENEWELVFITAEPSEKISFAIRKISD